MIKVLLATHLLIALAMVGVVLLQRSDGGALGVGGGGTGFMTGRQAGNLLTRTTAFLAAMFVATSLALAVLGGGGTSRQSILDQVQQGGREATVPGPVSPPAAAPAFPAASDLLPAPPPAPADATETSPPSPATEDR